MRLYANELHISVLKGMKASTRIWVAGQHGMVGKAISHALLNAGFTNQIFAKRRAPDLSNWKETLDFVEFMNPKVIVVTAGLVGGIVANSTQPVEFLTQNALIAINVIQAAAKCGVEKLLYLGSSCIYPRNAPQPMKPECLLSNFPEASNEAYALAKIMGLKLCQYQRKQYHRNFITAMPCNLYGPGDTYDLAKSHVIPALIERCHKAKMSTERTLKCLGDGSPQREFLFVNDLACACVTLLTNYNESEIVNIGSGELITINRLVGMVKEVVGYNGKITWSGANNGMPVKVMDSSLMRSMGWDHTVSLPMGLQLAYEDYKERFCGKAEEYRID
jgi:GDP-L-fucose synthase